MQRRIRLLLFLLRPGCKRYDRFLTQNIGNLHTALKTYGKKQHIKIYT
jgi:hypothetical protein